MSATYYVLMNDYASPYQSTCPFGILALEPDTKLPVRPGRFSFPYDVKEISQSEIFWNFDKVEPLLFDYHEYKGHILSSKIAALLDGLKLAPHYKMRLNVYMEGKPTSRDYFYLAFDRGQWVKGVQQDPNHIFYDVDRSTHQLDRDGVKLPTGFIALTSLASQYDVFQIINVSYLSAYMVFSAKAKAQLEKHGIKGGKFVPLQEAFDAALKECNQKLSDLLPKVKKPIKPWFADISKK
ncbi:hypothetical protein ACSSVW_002831 [Pseudoalteromonas sp. MBR-15]|jgi:hypothetical protein